VADTINLAPLNKLLPADTIPKIRLKSGGES
jgi:hypothetical protein